MNELLNVELVREIQHQLNTVLAAAQTSSAICQSIEAVPDSTKNLQKGIVFRIRALISSLDGVAIGEVNSKVEFKQHLGREFDGL